MADVANPLGVTPKEAFAQFILKQAENFFLAFSNPATSDAGINYSITALISMLPDKSVRQEIYSSYFDNKDRMGVRTAALLACGDTVSSLAISMSIVESINGAWI
jgi:hypothetical protein